MGVAHLLGGGMSVVLTGSIYLGGGGKSKGLIACETTGTPILLRDVFKGSQVNIVCRRCRWRMVCVNFLDVQNLNDVLRHGEILRIVYKRTQNWDPCHILHPLCYSVPVCSEMFFWGCAVLA